MKIHPQPRMAVICTAAFFLVGLTLAQEPGPGAAPRMKAVVYHEFGSPTVLRMEEVDKPVPNDNQLLVKVRAVSINPLDWHYMEGTPYIARAMGFGYLKPANPRLGVDYAGTVEAVGKNVTQFKPGDDVFGGKTGAFAEYVCVMADRAVTLKPASVTFEQAASVPIAGLTALQGLRDKGNVQPGQKVLINGASGGVGTFAVQIAKSLGAEVTGVCSTRNLEMVQSIGADHVIDYTKEDFTKSGQLYDVIVDNVANHTALENGKVLKPGGRYVLIGGGGLGEGRWIGPFGRVIDMLLLSPVVSQKMTMLLAEFNQKDMQALADLMESGKVKPVIDRTYKLSQMPEAMGYLEEGHARGKVVLTVEENGASLIHTNPTAGFGSTTNPVLVAFTFMAVLFGATILPIILAIALNRRFRQRNPEKRSYRWGYYFGILSVIKGLVLGVVLDVGLTTMIMCGLIYALLAWFFLQRRHWAWIALTILSFNPIAWIINFFYLRKRWAENAAATAI